MHNAVGFYCCPHDSILKFDRFLAAEQFEFMEVARTFLKWPGNKTVSNMALFYYDSSSNSHFPYKNVFTF